MGLLDDAIREHLELKRRTGADPGEIARAEHEALEPIFPDEPPAIADGSAPLAHEAQADEEAVQLDEMPDGDQVVAPAESADFAHFGQETAELDMQAVLDADPGHPPGQFQAPPSSARPVHATPAGQMPEQDSMEWEVPGSQEPRAIPEEVPGQERMSFE